MRSRKTVLVIATALLVLVAAFVLTPAFMAKAKYDDAKAKYEKELPGPFVVKDFDSTMREMIREIETEWTSQSIKVDGPYTLALKTADMAPTVANIAKLFNYRMPSYGWFDPDSNAKSLSIAAVQATIVPVSKDQIIHMSSDASVALLLHSDNVVSIFRETDMGLQEAFWFKKGTEPGDEPDR